MCNKICYTEVSDLPAVHLAQTGRQGRHGGHREELFYNKSKRCYTEATKKFCKRTFWETDE
jgi:hypothetical protein